MRGFGSCLQPATPPVPHLLSSLLHRTRAAILVMLLVVLPLQSVVQLVVGLQGHRHLHAGAASPSPSPSPWPSALRVLLDRLHAAQDPRLQPSLPTWLASRGAATELHAHGGVFHRHAPGDASVVEVGDAGDDPGQAGATAFLAWLPAALAVPASEAGVRPGATEPSWRDCVVAPALAPPRA